MITCISLILMPVLLSLYARYRYPVIIPTNFNLVFWKDVLASNIFRLSVISSLMLGFLNGILSTFIGFLGARALCSYDFKGKLIITRMFSMPLFIPGVTLMLGVQLLFLKLKLGNTITGVLVSHMVITLPYATSIIYNYLIGVDKRLEYVAYGLGSSKYSYYRYILLPMISPSFGLSFALSNLISQSEYLSTVLIGGGSVSTLSTLMMPYIQGGDRGRASVVICVFVLINISVFLIVDIVIKKQIKAEGYLYES